MDLKGGETGQGNPTPPNGPRNPWEDALNEMDAPKKNEIGLATVIERRREFASDFRKKLRGSYTCKDIVDSITEDTKSQDLIIRGPVEVARGDKAILVLSHGQTVALKDVFNLSDFNMETAEFYVLLESTGNDSRKVEAILKSAPIKPTTENHLIISSALAKELGIGEQKRDIRILDVYQKVGDIDLDKV